MYSDPSSSPFRFALRLSSSLNPRLHLFSFLKSITFLVIFHQIEALQTILISFRTFLTDQNSFVIQKIEKSQNSNPRTSYTVLAIFNQNFLHFGQISTSNHSLDSPISSIPISFLPKPSMAARPQSQRRARTKHTPLRHSSPFRPPSQDFESLHFPNALSAQRFRDKFIGKPITPSFSINIDEFSDITICSRNITYMLSHWNKALSIEEHVYENLVRVFYSNMELSSSRQVQIITFIGGVHIEFDEEDLFSILGIHFRGLDIYTTRKELDFNDFRHVDGVRNICRHRDLFDDLCSLSFRSQLLPYQVCILYSILQHMVTP